MIWFLVIFQIKAKLQPVKEDSISTPTCDESPCLPDGLSPFKKTFPDISNCLSPVRKRKLENEPNSTPHAPPRQRKKGVTSVSDTHENSPGPRKRGIESMIETYTSSPVPKRLTRRPISVSSEYSQVCY